MPGILAGPNPLSKLIKGNVLGAEISTPSWKIWAVAYELFLKCSVSAGVKMCFQSQTKARTTFILKAATTI